MTVLQNFLIPSAGELTGGVSIGSVIYFPVDMIPDGYLECDGSEIPRTSILGNILGDTWGDGDGSTTYNLPDGRAQFLRDFDDGTLGLDPDAGVRVFGENQADMVGDHTHTLRPFATNDSGSGVPTASNNNTIDTYMIYEVSQTAGAETRPVNMALLVCIREK